MWSLTPRYRPRIYAPTPFASIVDSRSSKVHSRVFYVYGDAALHAHLTAQIYSQASSNCRSVLVGGIHGLLQLSVPVYWNFFGQKIYA